MNNTKIGQFISEKRKSLGLTQQELAEKLQITNKAVSKWETGDGMPDIQILQALANELGITVDEILNGEEKPKENFESPVSSKCFSVAPVSAIVICILGVFSAIYGVIMSASGISNVLGLKIYGDSFIARIQSFLMFLGFGAYWIILTAIFMCRLLKIFNYKFKAEKTLTIVAFVIGFVMLFAQGMDYSPINYGLFFFSFALLFGTFHGYRVPHKVFYGLTILAVCIFGISSIFSEGITDTTQRYLFVLRFIRAIIFYVFYGLLEKFSNEYQYE